MSYCLQRTLGLAKVQSKISDVDVTVYGLYRCAQQQRASAYNFPENAATSTSTVVQTGLATPHRMTLITFVFQHHKTQQPVVGHATPRVFLPQTLPRPEYTPLVQIMYDTGETRQSNALVPTFTGQYNTLSVSCIRIQKRVTHAAVQKYVG